MVLVDTIFLQDLLNNLLTNAIKYNHTPGSIIFRAWEENEKIFVSISDTGIGLNDEQKTHIFKEFYKADCSRHDFNSSGSGLSISKKIVELLGGNIWVESEGKEKGYTFYFSLNKAYR